MTGKGHIFLSYRSTEAGFALRFAADLKNMGVQLWMDRLDGWIEAGDDWVASLQEALDHSMAVIAVLSPDYVAAKYCRRELKRADTLGIPILPVLLCPLTVKQWPLEIQEKQYIDFREWHDERTYNQQLSRLVEVLSGRFPAQFGGTPSSEEHYLTNLISDLEKHEGVEEYVPLSAQVDVPEAESFRPDPRKQKSRAAGFSFLVDEPATSSHRREKRRVPIGDIQAALEKHHRFVLVGEPGAGKTTTLRRLAVDAARECLRERGTAPIPLFLNLPSWKDGQEITGLINARWPFGNDPMELLARGDVLLYLDGLNEMGAKGPERARQLRAWLHTRGAPRNVIVTCREGDYAGDLELGLPTVIVEQMDEDHIRQFVTNYLGDRARPFLNRILPGNEELREDTRHLFLLARNPYLLSALIYVYDNSPQGDLPGNPGLLIKRLVMTLWERERAHQTRGWRPFEEMEAAFSRLAFAMVDEELPISVPVDYALGHLESAELLHAGHSASFVEVRNNEVHFYHQLVQEYFAAVRLAQVGMRDRLPIQPLTEPPPSLWSSLRFLWAVKFSRKPWSDLEKYLASFMSGRKWHEVVVALCGILPNADGILAHVLAANDFTLAGRCISSGGNISEAARKDAVRQLLDALPRRKGEGRDETSNRRHDVAEALGEIGDADAVPGLLDAFNEKDAAVSQEPIEDALVKIGGDVVLAGLFDIIRQRSSPRWGGAAMTLGKMRVESAVPFLLEALSDRNWSGRWAAPGALGKIRNTEAMSGLIDALRDRNCDLRDSIAYVLSEIGDPIAVPALLEALSDTSNTSWGRSSAAAALERIGAPAAAPGLLEALAAESTGIRFFAARALGSMGDPSAVPRLTSLLTDLASESWSSEIGRVCVCDMAAQALRKIGTKEALAAVKQQPERILPLLDGEDVEVRVNAIEKLGYLRDTVAIPKLVELLKDRKTKDKRKNRLCDLSAQALTRIGTPEALAAVEEWRR